MVNYKSVEIQGIKIFYREAGFTDKKIFVLFHGFPSASHMFRDLIPQLENNFICTSLIMVRRSVLELQ